MDTEWLYIIEVEDIHATPENIEKLNKKPPYSLEVLKVKEIEGKKCWEIWANEEIIYDIGLFIDIALFIRGCWDD